MPGLLVVAHTRSCDNDERHQERLAQERLRPVEHPWSGQRIAEPAIALAMMARVQWAVGIGPGHDLSALHTALAQAIEAVRNGQVYVVAVRVVLGSDTTMSGAAAARS